MKLNLKEFKNKLKKLAKNINTVYNTNGLKLNLCTEGNPIVACESCQVRKEAAISGYYYVEIAFRRGIKNHTIFYIKDVKKWGTTLHFIENLGQWLLMKW